MQEHLNALEYLKRTLPVADQITVSDETLERIARHACAVREATPWGRDIPDDIFRAFVLFPRVNNEDAVFYHGPIWRELAPRLAGKTMEQAVLEINIWCCEKATYQSTDVRTANALTVIRRGFGRCGEESVLLVSALRAACIPACQVYVPRWAHCDDNHAWVEAWTGDWHYMGACEPEPVLDSGWFTAAASKAMLVHTRVYDPDYAREPVLASAGYGRMINRTAAYANVKPFCVYVTRAGKPLPGVTVRFELVNMAELYPIHQALTDKDGAAPLVCGLGTLHIHVTDGERFICRMADVAAQDVCEIDFDQAAAFDGETRAYAQRPPQETRIQPSEFSPEQDAAHTARLHACEARRQAAHSGDEPNEYLKKAGLNRGEIARFLDDARFEPQDKQALMDTLRDKDFADVTHAVLIDALENALPYRARYPHEVWARAVLCPRVGHEMLFPVRAQLRAAAPVQDALEAWRIVTERTRCVPMEPATLYPNLYAALERGLASPAVQDALFVALSRANGIAARLNPATGEKEMYEDGAFRALFPAQKPDARLTLVGPPGSVLRYGVDFTLGVLNGGAYRTLSLDGLTLEGERTLEVAGGCCRVVTATRQIDGAVDGLTISARVVRGEETRVKVQMREDRTAERLLRQPLPPLFATLGAARVSLPESLGGLPALVAFLHPGQEPTEHFLNELLEAGDALDQIAVRLLVSDPAQLKNDKLRAVLAATPAARALHTPDHAALLAWRRLLHAGDLRLPFAVAVDAVGRGLFAYVNYNVGSVQSLLRMIRCDGRGAEDMAD